MVKRGSRNEAHADKAMLWRIEQLYLNALFRKELSRQNVVLYV